MTHDAPEAVQRFPLQWPIGWKRTSPNRRVAGSFSQTKHDIRETGVVKRQVAVSLNVALQRIERRISALGASDPTLSSNVRIRLDGLPDSRNSEVIDPGVAVYFRFRGRATVLACDRYHRVADNIAAISAHIDALRRIDRYGVGTIEQALAGYRALPADTAADWRNVFGFGADERVTVPILQERFKQRAHVAHPDKGGTEEMMMHINRARDYAMTELNA